jgi:phosphopantothenoylcysteine decarboxylase/phosphopantothenate--cysteine ligase
VITSLWEDAGADDGSYEASSEQNGIEHISEAQWADALVVAPATANILAKFAHGIADDFLTTMYLATQAPVLVAPAMNVNMWNHPATQANLETLRHWRLGLRHGWRGAHGRTRGHRRRCAGSSEPPQRSGR